MELIFKAPSHIVNKSTHTKNILYHNSFTPQGGDLKKEEYTGNIRISSLSTGKPLLSSPPCPKSNSTR